MTEQDRESFERLVRVETKLDMALSTHASTDGQLRDGIAKLDAQHDKDVAELDARIVRLERAMWIATGIAAAVGGAVGTGISNILGR